jgi:hypothetical protein
MCFTFVGHYNSSLATHVPKFGVSSSSFGPSVGFFFDIYRGCLRVNLGGTLGLGATPFIEHSLHGGAPIEKGLVHTSSGRTQAC